MDMNEEHMDIKGKASPESIKNLMNWIHSLQSGSLLQLYK
jgi:hypothetical protein